MLAAAPSVDERLDDERVDHGSTRGDLVDGPDELVHFGQTLLEQVRATL